MKLLNVVKGSMAGHPERAARSIKFAQWDAWARTGGANGANRNEAVRRLKAFTQADLSADLSASVLNLAGLGLSSLPRNLPASLRMLDLSENEFNQVPENLPPALSHLNLRGNLLTSLSEALPRELRRLNLSDNQLNTLPDRLPSSIIEMYAQNNDLTRLPESLPKSLRRLNVSSNNLVELPAHLPKTLYTLEAKKNLLEALPETLPPGLESIDVTQNNLRRLPTKLPVLLQQLIVRQNRLIELPKKFPRYLSYLDAEHNQLQQLQQLPHDVVGTSGGSCAINLGGNPVEPSEIDRIRKAVADDTYTGPRFDFSLKFRPFQDGDFRAQSLAASVAQWLGSNQAEITKWHEFQNEEGADAFSVFLDRLTETINFKNRSFRATTTMWLVKLAYEPVLRNATFAESIGATETCQDRVSLTLNRMKKIQIDHDVQEGHYDHDLAGLIALARGNFRLDKLEKIAHKTVVEHLRNNDVAIDEIEVYLKFQVALRASLKLPVHVADMRFSQLSHVTPKNIRDAERDVRAMENKEFSVYLSDWVPWRSVIKRLDPALDEVAKEKLGNAVEQDFDTRLAAALKIDGMEFDDDAQRIKGPSILKEIADEIHLDLTKNFLVKHQQAALLNKQWRRWYVV